MRTIKLIAAAAKVLLGDFEVWRHFIIARVLASASQHGGPGLPFKTKAIGKNPK